MWDVIRELVADGATLLLTTQYLEEADELADRIVVIDHGRVIAEGTSAELKGATGGARLEVTLTEPAPGGRTGAAAVRRRARSTSARTAASSRPRSGAASGLATTVVRALDAAGVLVDDVEVHQPSLDDVFFALTGQPTAGDEPATPNPHPSWREPPHDRHRS